MSVLANTLPAPEYWEHALLPIDCEAEGMQWQKSFFALQFASSFKASSASSNLFSGCHSHTSTSTSLTCRLLQVHNSLWRVRPNGELGASNYSYLPRIMFLVSIMITKAERISFVKDLQLPFCVFPLRLHHAQIRFVNCFDLLPVMRGFRERDSRILQEHEK